MIEKIFFLLDLIDNVHELQAHLDKILKLCNRDFSGLDLEKLACNVNIYSMRLNKTDRLLYTLVKDKIFILELVLNHDYQKSRFLNHPQLLKNLLNYLKTYDSDLPEDVFFDLSFSKVEEPSHQFMCVAPRKTLELVPVVKHDKKLIQLNSSQQQAMFFEGALIVTGGAGSGKTCVAESKIKCFFSEIRLSQKTSDSLLLFTTESEGLLHYQHHQFKQDPSLVQVLDNNSQFASFKKVIEPILAKLQLSSVDAEFVFFKQWFEKKYQQFPYALEFVWRELRNASGYDKVHYINEIGNKNTQIQDKHMRSVFYDILENYLLYLNSKKLFSPNLQKLPSQIMPIYDMILVDEAQDLTTAQLSNLNQLAKNNQIVYFLGEHQVVYDSISKFHFLEHLFYKQSRIPLNIMQLPSCYRNPLPILRIINKLIEIKCLLTGGVIDKHESPVLELAEEHIVSEGDLLWMTPDDVKLKEILIPYIDNPHFAVIVDNEQEIAEALEFLACPPEQVFTKTSCKGFEFKYVLLWKPLQSDKLRQIDKKIAELVIVEETKVFHRAKNKSLDDDTLIVFNQLITAFSRSTEFIIMVEHKKFHPQQNLIDFITPLFNLAPINIVPVKSAVEDWIALVVTFLREDRKKEAQAIFERHLMQLFPDFNSFCTQHGFLVHQVQELKSEEQKIPDVEDVSDSSPTLNIEFEEVLFNSKLKKDKVSLKSSISALMESKNLSKDLLAFFNLFRCGRSLHVALFDKLIIDYSFDGKRGRKQKKAISLIDWLLRKEQRDDVVYAFASYPQVLMKFPFKDCVQYLESSSDITDPLDEFNHFILIQYFLFDAYRKKEITAQMLFCPEQAPPLAILLAQFNLTDLLPSLITKGIDLMALAPNGDSIVHVAYKNKQFDLLHFLENIGLDLNLTDAKGWSIGHYVAVSGNIQDFEHLAELKINWFYEPQSPLHLAIQNNQYQFIEKVNEIYPLNSELLDRCDLLGVAFYLNRTDVIVSFLKMGLDFCKDDKFLKLPYFFLAVNCQNTLLLEQFIRQGINLKAKNIIKQNIVHYAVQKKALVILDFLWENPTLRELFTEPDNLAYLPVHFCAHDQELHLATWFKQKGADAGFIKENFYKLAQQAVKNNNPKLLLWLLEQGFNIDQCNEMGTNLLHIAVQNQSLEMVDFLLHQNLSIENFDERQKCPMLIAAEIGNIDIFKRLYSKAGHLNQKDTEGNNIAHIAVLFFNKAIIEFLLELPQGRALYFENNLANQSPIIQSIILDRIEFLDLYHASKLFDFNAPLQKDETPVTIGIKYASQKFLKKSLKFGINMHDKSLLFNALRHKNNTIFMILLHLGAPYIAYDQDQRCLTDVAASLGNVIVLEMLFNLSQMKSEDLNYLFKVRMDLIVREAILNNQYHVIEWIAKNKILNPLLVQFHEVKGFVTQSIHFGTQQIIEAAKLGHLETLATLYKNGINIFKADESGRDIIEIAIKNQNIKILSLCRELGYRFDVMREDGKFPIILAAESGSSLVVDFLILCNVNCQVRRLSDRASPIMIAAEKGYVDVVKTLIDLSNLNASNINGENLMHIAVLNYQPKVVEILTTCKEFNDLMHTPDKTLDYTPLELIAIQNNQEIAKLLIKLGFSFEITPKLSGLVASLSPEMKQLLSKKSILQLSVFQAQPLPEVEARVGLGAK